MEQDIGQRIAQGLARIGIAQRQKAWSEGASRNLSPTQAQIISMLATSGSVRLKTVAEQLAVTPATASDAVRVLVEKGLVAKKASANDGRAVSLALTASGRRESKRVAQWPEFIASAVDALDETEKAVLLRGLVKMIGTLQSRGEIPISRMCTTCRFFRPHAYSNAAQPHHCDFVDAPFGDVELQTNCPDHDAATDSELQQTIQLFVHGKAAT